jgi:hypothetical protein
MKSMFFLRTRIFLRLPKIGKEGEEGKGVEGKLTFGVAHRMAVIKNIIEASSPVQTSRKGAGREWIGREWSGG